MRDGLLTSEDLLTGRDRQDLTHGPSDSQGPIPA
jgi:hypothetical protein